MSNIKVTISWEYEDKYGGTGYGEEEISDNIFSLAVLEDKIDGAVGRTMKHLRDFRDFEPLPDDEAPTESEAYRQAHD